MSMATDLIPQKWYKKRDNLLLLVILSTAFALRFYRLDHESLWLDEVQSMKQSDPFISSWQQMFQYLGWDQHPPLFYILERCFLTIVRSGNDPEFIGRILPAILGVLSVWAVYLLGKEIGNSSMGLIAAAITCVNYYNLLYSQEIRDYILVFLTSALSYVYFIRLIRSRRSRDLWLYTLFAALTAYSHYYGIFIVVSQFFLAAILVVVDKDRKTCLKDFAISGVVIVLLYLPWAPQLMKMVAMKSFWNPPVPGDFFVDYFKGYFGDDNHLLIPVILVLLSFVLIKVMISRRKAWAGFRNNPAIICFLLLFSAVLFVFVLPYIRSRVNFAMLFPRYTIVILPLLMVSIACGVMVIPFKPLRMIVAIFLVIFSFTNVVIDNKFYSSAHKMQLREATSLATRAKASKLPIFNDGIDWQLDYYIRKSGYSGPLVGGPRKANIDSVLVKRSSPYNAGGFWLVDVHSRNQYLDSTMRAALDSQYVLALAVDYFDAFAELYMAKDSVIQVTAGDFRSGIMTSNALPLKKGNYVVGVESKGIKVKGDFAKLGVFVDDKKIGDYYTTKNFQIPPLYYRQSRDEDSARIRIVLENDVFDPKTKEDRNAFLKKIVLIRE
jgi:mannosyltransferase